MRPLFVGVALVALGSTGALAADSSVYETRPTALYLQLGLGTPTGTVGAEVEQTLTPHVAVAGGAGWGNAGPQVAGMARLRFGRDRAKFVMGGGLSGGEYEWVRFCMGPLESCPNKRGTVAWTNFEMGGSHRAWNGLSFRYFVGYGRIVAGKYECVADAAYDVCIMSHRDDGKNLFYTGVAIGYAF
jgi:hypothetical protein